MDQIQIVDILPLVSYLAQDFFTFELHADIEKLKVNLKIQISNFS